MRVLPKTKYWRKMFLIQFEHVAIVFTKHWLLFTACCVRLAWWRQSRIYLSLVFTTGGVIVEEDIWQSLINLNLLNCDLQSACKTWWLWQTPLMYTRLILQQWTLTAVDGWYRCSVPTYRDKYLNIDRSKGRKRSQISCKDPGSTRL